MNEYSEENLETLLKYYHLVFDPSVEFEFKETEKITSCILCEENWKVFFDQSFNYDSLKDYLSSISDVEKCKEIFNFGIACIFCFVQCNFTGPDFDKEVECFLKNSRFTSFNFAKELSVNNESINGNTRFPFLLVTAKIIFEACMVNNIINNWWYWRSVMIHQQILDELCPSLLAAAEVILNQLQLDPALNADIRANLDIEVAQLYLLFRYVSKAKEHILLASNKLGVQYKLVGALGKRTKYQERDIPQLTLKVTLEESRRISTLEETNIVGPVNVPLNDDVRLNHIQFSDIGEREELPATEQKLFVTIVQESMIAKPQDELETEEIRPFVETVLSNKNNAYAVKIVALLLRCKLEVKSKRTIERSLGQCEEILNSLKKPDLSTLQRISDVFGTGMPPIWKIESQYADLLLNTGLVKNALDIYLKLKLWEEVIVCYTILKMRHKAAEIIQEQLDKQPTEKLWCLLGDATDDESCYEKAWELSKGRSHRAQRHWGQYLFERKQYGECIPHFEKSVSINPLQANVWFRLGFAALQTDNWQTAATAYRRYTTLEPDGFEAWNNLAQAYIKIGNKRSAHQAILEALKCNYENWKVWENLLVISCDISQFSDVIRAYHMLLDIKEKYLNVEVLNMLVYNVCNNVIDVEGKSAQRFLKQTRELLGRVTSIYSGDGYVWEMYANLAPGILLRAQRLQRAYRGYTQGNWNKSSGTCVQVLHVCVKLAKVALDDEVDPADSIVNSIKLNLNSALIAIKKQNWSQTKDLENEASMYLDNILQKLKSIVDRTKNPGQ